MTSAKAVAGMVMGIPRSLARARSASYPAILPFQCDKATGVESDAVQAAFLCLFRNVRGHQARESRQPKPFPLPSADYLSAGARLAASIAARALRREHTRRSVSRKRRRSQLLQR